MRSTYARQRMSITHRDMAPEVVRILLKKRPLPLAFETVAVFGIRTVTQFIFIKKLIC